MKFPNKVNRYKTTTLFNMVEIITILKSDMLPTEIFAIVSRKMSALDFYEALTALYAVGKICYLKSGRIKNVGRN